MQELKLIGVEDRELILAADDGATFRLPITAAIESAVRPPAGAAGRSRQNTSPRELQALLRSGLSVEQVADQTGAPVDDVRRFEAPIAAELAYMIDNARDVALRLTGAGTSDDGSSFGEIIDSRLANREVTDASWSSWKEDTGWVIQLEFTSGGAPLDARWSFDPKRRLLSPINEDARSISSEEPPVPARAVRLRAIPSADSAPETPAIYDREQDPALFDSADAAAEASTTAAPTIATVTPLSAKRDERPHATDVVETQDLLEALRQRRGERQPLPTEPTPEADDDAYEPEFLGGGVTEKPADPAIAAAPSVAPEKPDEEPAAQPRTRSNRTAMPSWDEIVFGSRSNTDDS